MIVVAASFAGMMALAVLSDISSMTIPNRLNLALVAAFALSALWVGMPGVAAAFHLGFAFAILAVTAAMFALGWMGGGDAKLIAATALWFGPSLVFLDYVLLASVLGGVLTLAIVSARGLVRPTTGVASLDRILSPDNGIPYGVALGGSGLVVALSADWSLILS